MPRFARLHEDGITVAELIDAPSAPAGWVSAPYHIGVLWRFFGAGRWDFPAHVTQPREVTPGEWEGRFTDAELDGIVAFADQLAAGGNYSLKRWLLRLPTLSGVSLDSPILAGMLDNFVAAGILTSARKAEVLL